mgnify:CR=1 FL=1
MSGVLSIEGLTIPTEALSDLAAFRRWVGTLDEGAPRVHFGSGGVCIEMSQNCASHLVVVRGFTLALAGLGKELSLGEYYPDGGWLTNETAGLSTQPDGFLVLWDTFDSGEARFQPRASGDGSVELVGRGDMVLEVVSDNSVKKDTVDLVRDYARAGFPEYWIVDARGEQPSFRILRLAGSRYRDVRPDSAGWRASKVWGCAFRLVKALERPGHPRYDLLVRRP